MVQAIDETRRRQHSGGRIPPQNLQAEESVLGAMLLSRDAIAAVAELHLLADALSPLRELLSENLDRLEALYERGEAITGTPTGYVDLDQQLAGLQPSNLVVVGARPAMGKTAFALGMAAHAALTHQVPV